MGMDEHADTLARAFRQAGVDKTLGGKQALGIAVATDLPLRTVERYALAHGVVPRRYEKNLGTLGLAGQQKLLDGQFMVVGLGGLGGQVVEDLARLGAGRLVVVDPDAFDETNLNRQALSTLANPGQPKADAACARVAQINRAVEVIAHRCRFEDLQGDLFAGCDLVFDCLDSLPARLALARRCAAADVTLVHGAIAGWTGEVGICPPGSEMMQKLCTGKSHGLERTLGTPPFTAALTANLMVARGVAALLNPAGAEEELNFVDLQHAEWERIEF